MRKKAKTILILTILFLTLMLAFTFSPIQNIASATTCTTDADCKKGEGCKIEEGKKEGECVRALEIVYPQIPGYTTEKVIFSGLPEYIEYIFRFSIWLIGFVILGALIYAGFQYFTSFGNPEKLSAAKNGIISAFLGGIILLGAVLIFNTINPQLVILEAPPLDILDPTVMPGIYLCNKKVDDIDGIIVDYMSGDKDRRLNAAKDFMEVIQDDKGFCFRVPKSGNLKIGNIKKFEFDPINQTVFAIPREDFINEKWVYDYGIIFHEKDNFQGLCRLAVPYQKANPAEVNPAKVRSVTLFQKLEEQPSSTSQGVILYPCLNYEDPAFCPEGVTTTAGTPFPRTPFPPDDDIREVSNEELGVLASGMGTEWVTGGFWIFKIKYYQKQRVEDKTAGARSIKIDPEGAFFAVLLGQNLVKYKSKENPEGLFCEVISNNDPNLLDNDIGRCGDKCQIVSPKDETKDWQIQSCYLCLRAMAVIKGQVLK